MGLREDVRADIQGIKTDIKTDIRTVHEKLDKFNEQAQKNKTDIAVLAKTTISITKCEKRRKTINAEVSKVGRINKIVGVIATGIGAIGAGIMWLTARLWGGG